MKVHMECMKEFKITKINFNSNQIMLYSKSKGLTIKKMSCKP